jgi:aerobic-type carbon monoxide dehydrogenase small subunit (CoxS/CutS family)
MILTASCLLEENAHPNDEEIKTALGGNLCRCGCYVKIINAVKRAGDFASPVHQEGTR